MGHRALVAYERTDGRYDLHYSHWGAERLRLSAELGPDTPYGTPSGDPPTPPVDPSPIATVTGIGNLATDHVDYLVHEAVYVVSRDWDVSAYRTLWFGFDPDDETVGNGALVDPRSRDPLDDARLAAWFRGVKDAVRPLMDAGVLSPEAATDHLEAVVLGLGGRGHRIRVARPGDVQRSP